MQRLLLYSVALSLLLTSTRSARADRVDDYIRTIMQKQHIPGLSLAVVKDGRVVKARGYGMANLELSVPVTPRTVFQSGSVGKQFTATAVMMLVEEGKIGLDDPIRKYLGDMPDSWKEITIRHLLTHTSGIPGYDYGRTFDLRKDYTEDELLKMAEAMPLDFAPGEKWRYSNTGYVLLGILIHKVTGQFYGDLLQERIFKPLGMTSTRIISEEEIIPNRAAGYQLKKRQIKNQDWVAPLLNTTADGSLYLTALDLAKWDQALYTEKLLKRSSLEQMWTPVKLNNGKTYPYGFGWELDSLQGHRRIWHTGAWQGFLSYIGRFTEDRLAVIVLVNTDSAAVSTVGNHIASLYFPAHSSSAPNSEK